MGKESVMREKNSCFRETALVPKGMCQRPFQPVSMKEFDLRSDQSAKRVLEKYYLSIGPE